MTLTVKTFKLARAMCLASLTAASALCATTGVHAQMAQPGASSASMPMQHGAAGSGAMKQSMEGGMDGMKNMQMSGDPDRDFAMMMKMHHQGAVHMAQMELAHGKSTAMKDMAKKIIAAQKQEIAQFDRWLALQK